MIRKGLILLVLCVGMLETQAQYKIWDQYVSNNYLLNPAVSGIEKYVDLQVGYRMQWIGMDGAPSSGVISLHGPLTRHKKRGFSRIADDSETDGYTPPNVRSKGHHGLGALIINDRIGPFQTTDATASYAYHMPISSKLSCSMGLAAGVESTGINNDYVSISAQTDPAVAGSAPDYRPVVRVGLLLYSQSIYVGLSRYQTMNATTGEPVNYFATAGYRLYVNNYWKITPFTAVRYSAEEINFDVGFSSVWDSRVWVGANLRSTQALNMFGGVNISPLLGVSGSYCMWNPPSSKSMQYTGEVTLHLRLLNSRKLLCPQQML